MLDVTAIILTKNEEKNLPACLDSLLGRVGRIVVMDSFSSDRTCELAAAAGADVYQHGFENYGAQFQYALDHTDVATQWVLRIDADERLTPEAYAEMEQICSDPANADVSGVVLRFKVHFMGKALKHGGAYPMRKLCLFRTGMATMEQRYMDEQLVVTSGRVIEMQADLEHDDFKDLSHWIDKHNWYASRAARDYYDNKDADGDTPEHLDMHSRINRVLKYGIYYRLPSRLRTWLYFAYRYYLRGGFLDGKQGYWYAFFQAYWYRTLVDAKIFEAQEKPEAIADLGALK